MKKKLLVIWILGMTVIGYAQTGCLEPAFSYRYRMVRMDSTWDAKGDPGLAQYIQLKHQQLEDMVNVVIGRSAKTLVSFSPESPLSNFLTNLLLERAPQYVDDPLFAECDVSLLNFGGIRAQIPAGDIRIADLYNVSPFENCLVFLQIKGSELKKALMRFTDKVNAPMAGVEMTYRNGKPVNIRVQHAPIDDNRLYKVVTLDFLAKGGDNILKDIVFEKTVNTTMVFRDFLIEEIITMTNEDRLVDGDLEGRVQIERQP
ncbi:MAG: 5'-nucleotidase C-terminal domain-containing protein [Bacteroidales bacterium]|nr:5'-nucleotidase C-terminal domain-containing protein [Bacteroidales bacterium]